MSGDYLAEVSGAYNSMYAKAMEISREQGPTALDAYADQAGHELRGALTEIEPPPEWATLHAELLACSFPEGDAFPRTRDAEIALSRRMQRVTAELNAACLAAGIPPPFPDELYGGTTLELDGGRGDSSAQGTESGSFLTSALALPFAMLTDPGPPSR